MSNLEHADVKRSDTVDGAAAAESLRSDLHNAPGKGNLAALSSKQSDTAQAALPALTITDAGAGKAASGSAEPPGGTAPSEQAPATYKLGDGMGTNSADAHVKSLQAELNKLGYSTGGADGEFGSQTKEAVTEFQKANKIPATGELDPATQDKLADPHAVKNPNPRVGDAACHYPSQAEIERGWDRFFKTGDIGKPLDPRCYGESTVTQVSVS